MSADTGVKYKKVILTDLVFDLNRKFKPSPKGIAVDMDLSVKADFVKPNQLLCSLTVELFKNTAKSKNAPFYLRATMEGQFESDDPNALRDFAPVHAPAHLLPFVREVVANTTMRAAVPPLFIPPLNVKNLVEVNEKKKSVRK